MAITCRRRGSAFGSLGCSRGHASIPLTHSIILHATAMSKAVLPVSRIVAYQAAIRSARTRHKRPGQMGHLGRTYWTCYRSADRADGRTGGVVTQRCGRKSSNAVERAEGQALSKVRPALTGVEVPRRGDLSPTTPWTTIGGLRHAVNGLRVSGAEVDPLRSHPAQSTSRPSPSLGVAAADPSGGRAFRFR